MNRVVNSRLLIYAVVNMSRFAHFILQYLVYAVQQWVNGYFGKLAVNGLYLLG